MGRDSSRKGIKKEVLLALLLGLGVGFVVGAGLHFVPVQGGRPATEKDLVSWLQNRVSGGGAEKPAAPRLRITGLVDILPELRKELKATDTLFIIVTRPGETVPL